MEGVITFALLILELLDAFAKLDTSVSLSCPRNALVIILIHFYVCKRLGSYLESGGYLNYQDIVWRMITFLRNDSKTGELQLPYFPYFPCLIYNVMHVRMYIFGDF